MTAVTILRWPKSLPGQFDPDCSVNADYVYGISD